MKYTNAQIRGACLRAADRIAREPSCYNFDNWRIPKYECGTTGCMWGWLAFELGITGSGVVEIARRVLNEANIPFEGWDAPRHLYAFAERISPRFIGDPASAARCLRLYADKYFPVQAMDPAYLAFKSTLINEAVQS